jgi:hypothetical protein
MQLLWDSALRNERRERDKSVEYEGECEMSDIRDVKYEMAECGRCGSTRIRIRQHISAAPQFRYKIFVACDDCSLATGFYDTIEEAISAWNEINGVETETKSDKDLEIDRLRKENEELKARIAEYERRDTRQAD